MIRFDIPFKGWQIVAMGLVLAGAVRGQGVDVAGRPVAEVKVLGRSGVRTRLRVTIRRGLNRQVRRMLARTGLKVKRLTRISIGPIRLGGLKPGRSRPLTPAEERFVERLLAEVRQREGHQPRRGRE